MNEDFNDLVDEIVLNEQDNEAQGTPVVPKGAQKRIDELTRQKHDERRRADKLANELDELRAASSKPAESSKVTASGAPDPDKYPAGKYDPDYLEARQDWQIEQRFKAQDAAKHAQAKQGTIAQLEAAAAEVHADYSTAKDEFLAHDLAKVPAFTELIRDSENPAELAYFLGKNPDELDKIGDMTPAAANRYIGRLEARLTDTPTQANKKTSRAPTPINPLGGAKGSVGAKDPEKMTMDEYAAYKKSLKK